MKKTIAVIAISLIAKALAFADGCWVNESNPGICSNERIACADYYNDNVEHYGYQIADLCAEVYSQEVEGKQELERCVSLAQEEINKQYSQTVICIEDYNLLNSSYNSIVDSNNSNVKKIRRLRRKIKRLKRG